MRIVLEVEDVRYATTTSAEERIRWMTVKLGDKQFVVRREMDPWNLNTQSYRDEIDSTLRKTMELMLEAVVLNAAATVPVGAIETKCPSGFLWRFHYNGKCACEPGGGQVG